MSHPQSSNRRIAKNTLMLYIRMLISMLVGLYTSRVVLQTLGVEDYGIYGVVGGVVSMMGFLNASMSGATSRFITFELGKGDLQRVRGTFSSAMIIHIGIALVVILLAETVGLWFLCNKLVIPEGRMVAAHWVYQCSIISVAVGITQSPYTAVIMSREKMDIYAYMELLNVSLKLLIVYLLVIGNFDKLILYSILSLAVSVLIAVLYRVYCIRHFEESHFRWIWDEKLLLPLLSFSGWDLYGNMSATCSIQARSFMINMFGGVVFNTASAVSTTVYSTNQTFASIIGAAFRPQIVKSYARHDFSRMVSLINSSTKYCSILLSLTTIPLLMEPYFFFHLWLGEVPPFTIVFCRIMLVNSIINNFTSNVLTGIHATGKVRSMSVINGTLLLLTIPLTYLLLEIGYSPYVSYIVFSFIYFVAAVIQVLMLSQYVISFSIKQYLKESVIPVIVMMFLCIISTLMAKHYIPVVYDNPIITIIFSLILCLFLSYFFLLTSVEKEQFKIKLKKICLQYRG